MKKVMTDRNDIQVVVEVEELPFVPYDNLAKPPEEVKLQIAKDLDIDIKDVMVYFTYYHINSKFPIRKLSFAEMEFAKFINELRYADDRKIASLCDRVGISYESYLNNPLLLPQLLSGLQNDHNYRMLLKWRYYLLDPFLNYENSEPPILKPLTKMEMFLVTSNIAMGKSIIQGQKVDVRSQLAAVQQLIDAVNILPNPQVQELEEIDESIYDNLSVDQLKAGIAFIEQEKNPKPEPVVEPVPKKKATVKKTTGVKKTKKVESETTTNETKPKKTQKTTDKTEKGNKVVGRPKKSLEGK